MRAPRKHRVILRFDGEVAEDQRHGVADTTPNSPSSAQNPGTLTFSPELFHCPVLSIREIKRQLGPDNFSGECIEWFMLILSGASMTQEGEVRTGFQWEANEKYK